MDDKEPIVEPEPHRRTPLSAILVIAVIAILAVVVMAAVVLF